MGYISIARDTSIRKSRLEEMKNKIENENKEKEIENENENENKKKENEKKENVELEDKNENNENKNEEPKPEQIYDENNNLALDEEEKEDRKSIREAEDKEMENMNKTNQVMSIANFLKVMNMVGEVIINLGLIYFLQFFCVNALIIRVCSKVDIKFLPKGCSDNGHTYRRGKFEFVNLSYQIGMFISKTFIKIVRKIQPIEVYTCAIIIVNIIYITEYYTGFMPWGYFLGIGLVLGFFSGGTYAGGFYTILNSDRVDKNYKELTVNVATLFNDTGTFLSGIIGFFALNYLFDNDEAFKGQKVYPEDCDPD